MKGGDLVYLSCAGKTVIARIVFASEEGDSLAVVFGEFINGHVGGMPLSRMPDGTYRSLFNDDVVTLELMVE